MVYAKDCGIVDVWEKAHWIPGLDPAEWRRDDEGNLIVFGAYGDRNSPVGWEIDHIIPEALGGPSALWNLRPLWWVANARRGSAVLPVRSQQPRRRVPSGVARLAEALAAAEAAQRSRHAALAGLLGR